MSIESEADAKAYLDKLYEHIRFGLNDHEARGVAQFVGAMSPDVRVKKIEILDGLVLYLQEEIERLAKVRAMTKYSALSMDEIGEIWDQLDGMDDRKEMAFEIPELKTEYKYIDTEYSVNEIDRKLFGSSWYEQEFSGFDVRPYFERYCKK